MGGVCVHDLAPSQSEPAVLVAVGRGVRDDFNGNLFSKKVHILNHISVWIIIQSEVRKVIF